MIDSDSIHSGMYMEALDPSYRVPLHNPLLTCLHSQDEALDKFKILLYRRYDQLRRFGEEARKNSFRVTINNYI